ncbi:MAG: ATP-binding domain-containing protein [Nostoc sp. NMS7]|uniref:ATP-binding domain-containing protein n=1 Tax=Nostoc sp. NMS7 TaxID=2815391 RepID=UPI0025F497A3|nr:ATP-binding domain-containing protein [Nostoc sp. NMS7]MBN3946121.1 ATP-binding domain-containing protein [Nostoc sp. NMS7]
MEISTDVFKEIGSKKSTLDFSLLDEDQQEVLNKITNFVKNSEIQIFILQGTSNSGKSFLIPYIEKIAYQLGIEEVLSFAESTRVARNLMSTYNLENVNSIYSYIYGGTPTEVIDDRSDESDQTDEGDIIDIVPLRKCNNSDNSIFIVDESQLISDSFYESFDLRFGSGHLLKDYLEFTALKDSKRKIIFIGDPFQLSFGNEQESPLIRKYLEEKYQLVVDVAQLSDKTNYSPINAEALKCVSGISNKMFNDLQINQTSDAVIHLTKDKIETYISELNKSDIHILCFSNENAHNINLWIRRKLLKLDKNLAVGDIVLFYNNISVGNHDPFAPIKSIYNGDFGEINAIFEASKQEIKIKNISVTLSFREVNIKLNVTQKNISVLLLENYLNNPQAELGKEEKIALKIIINNQLKEEVNACIFEHSDEYNHLRDSEEYRALELDISKFKIRLDNGEQVKTRLGEKEKELNRLLKNAKKQYRNKIKLRLQNDPASNYFKFKNTAFIRYGYAMTVHKAMSYKWQKVVFNTNQGENRGRTNQDYFKWLYTGITRATSQIVLCGYEPITPLSYPNLKIQNSSDNNNYKDWVKSSFISKQDADLSKLLFESLSEDLKQYFDAQFKNTVLISLSLFISTKFQSSNLRIQAIKHNQYQEIYEVTETTNKNKTATIIFSYKSNGVFGSPIVQKAETPQFKDEVLFVLTRKIAISNITLEKKDGWREKLYNNLIERLRNKEIYLEYISEYISENNSHDLIKLFGTNGDGKLCIKLDYKQKGFISTITAIYCDDPNLWKIFQEVIHEYN